MLAGVNDSEQDARRLARLLTDRPAKVNLIPFNAFPGSDFRRSEPGDVDRFREILLKSDIMTITRKTRGADIAAACGQLAGVVNNRVRKPLGEKMNPDTLQ
jgi:23S rRNA (adenine2503-C2)-methyltransferase